MSKCISFQTLSLGGKLGEHFTFIFLVGEVDVIWGIGVLSRGKPCPPCWGKVGVFFHCPFLFFELGIRSDMGDRGIGSGKALLPRGTL